MPDLHRINQLVFHLQMSPAVSEGFTFDVGPVEAVAADGRTVTIIDPARADEAAPGRRVFARSTGPCRARLPPAGGAKGGPSWLGCRLTPPLDLSGYARLRVRWRAGSAKFNPLAGLQLRSSTAWEQPSAGPPAAADLPRDGGGRGPPPPAGRGER